MPAAHARRRTAFSGILVVVAVLALLGSCSSIAGSAVRADNVASGSEQPTRTTSPEGSVPTSLQRYYTQQLRWGSCAPYATTAMDNALYRTPGLSCARLTLPMDYRHPDGETINIGVLRKPATGTRKGSVLFNPGGPGASGMSVVATIAAVNYDRVLNESFDLIGFDPRGVGSSQPSIACQGDRQRDRNRAENWPGYMPSTTPAQVAAANEASKAFVAACVKTITEQGVDGTVFLANVGTADVAKDMDVLRAVLGDAQLTYVGWSYGTAIGTQYAEQFPRNVRAMILDGAINPSTGTAADALNQTKGFQQAFDAFGAWCAQQAGCPWDAADEANRTFQGLAQPLMAHPLPLPDGRVLSFSDAVTGVSEALYNQANWESLRDALQDFANGRGAALMALADSYNERDTDGHYSELLEAFTAIRCMDHDRITDAETTVKLNKELTEAAPFEDNGQPAAAVFDVCAFWPVPPTTTPHVPEVDGLAPVLVISTTGDPATPYQAGVALAGYLNGALLTVKGIRHTAFMLAGLGCVNAIGNDYLINLKLPASGASCP